MTNTNTEVWGNIELPNITDEELLTTNWNCKLAALERSKTKEWRQNVKNRCGSHEWILRTPGNDLLEFYDKFHLSYNPMPPSIVYHYRFDHIYPEFDRPYKRQLYLKEQLPQYNNTKIMYNELYMWLVDKPHTEYKFSNIDKFKDFVYQTFNQKYLHYSIALTGNRVKPMCLEHMIWRGKLKGWSIKVNPL